MKLRTLEDFEKQYTELSKYLTEQLRKGMSLSKEEAKLFKFESNQKRYSIVPIRELKQEAIKWIKHLRSYKSTGRIDSSTGFISPDEDIGSNDNVQEFIKHFFNISEEELK